MAQRLSNFAHNLTAKRAKEAMRPQRVEQHSRARAEEGKKARLAIAGKDEHAPEQKRAEEPEGEIIMARNTFH